ncbi:MAG TPA: hypothetical protein DCL61_10805 [Cyanobacteria bacterium UBA12227]|nr:hypothetical protein [Cyanobacteria bacterium UBA12227]HBY76729.1 hypothetical protein [Cyanobacteria bacterium UBA11148]
MNAQIGLLDAYDLLLYTFNFTPDCWDYEYRHQIFDEFLMLPEALEIIKTGLEQLFSIDFTQEQRESAHGFFELLQEQCERRGIISNSDGFIREFAELTRTTQS